MFWRWRLKPARFPLFLGARGGGLGKCLIFLLPGDGDALAVEAVFGLDLASVDYQVGSAMRCGCYPCPAGGE